MDERERAYHYEARYDELHERYAGEVLTAETEDEDYTPASHEQGSHPLPTCSDCRLPKPLVASKPKPHLPLVVGYTPPAAREALRDLVDEVERWFGDPAAEWSDLEAAWTKAKEVVHGS